MLALYHDQGLARPRPVPISLRPGTARRTRRPARPSTRARP